jgi:hypothetical protein
LAGGGDGALADGFGVGGGHAQAVAGEGLAQRRPGGAQLAGGGVDAAELLSEGEGAFGFGAVRKEAAGLPAQRVAIVPAPRLGSALDSERVLSRPTASSTPYHADAAAAGRLSLEGAPQHGGAGSLMPHPSASSRSRPVGQLGANAHGEILEAGRVPDCYLGLLLDPAEDAEAAGVLVVAPAALLHPVVPQPDGTLLYELVTGHPDRTPQELVFLADLAVELRAWPVDTWSKVGVDPQAVAAAVVAGWQCGDLPGLELGGLTAQEALALERPAMTYVRAQLGDRLQRQLARAARRQ